MKHRFLIFLLILLSVNPLSAQTIEKEDLQPGDILMYNGNNIISKVIMFFDGGEYSHSGIYDGENVLEAVNTGVKTYSLKQSIKDVNYVDVYRHRDMDSNAINDIQSVILKYEFFGERYSYEQFMLLGVLTAARKLPLEILAPVLRALMERAGTTLTNMIADGKQPMICSELIYRCYHEADTTGKLTLLIPATRVENGSLTDIALKIALQYLDKASDNMSDEMKSLKRELKQFRKDYAESDQNVDMDWSVADFITPYDLQKSPSLIKLGRLKLK